MLMTWRTNRLLPAVARRAQVKISCRTVTQLAALHSAHASRFDQPGGRESACYGDSLLDLSQRSPPAVSLTPLAIAFIALMQLVSAMLLARQGQAGGSAPPGPRGVQPEPCSSIGCCQHRLIDHAMSANARERSEHVLHPHPHSPHALQFLRQVVRHQVRSVKAATSNLRRSSRLPVVLGEVMIDVQRSPWG